MQHNTIVLSEKRALQPRVFRGKSSSRAAPLARFGPTADYQQRTAEGKNHLTSETTATGRGTSRNTRKGTDGLRGYSINRFVCNYVMLKQGTRRAAMHGWSIGWLQSD